MSDANESTDVARPRRPTAEQDRLPAVARERSERAHRTINGADMSRSDRERAGAF